MLTWESLTAYESPDSVRLSPMFFYNKQRCCKIYFICIVFVWISITFTALPNLFEKFPLGF